MVFEQSGLFVNYHVGQVTDCHSSAFIKVVEELQ